MVLGHEAIVDLPVCRRFRVFRERQTCGSGRSTGSCHGCWRNITVHSLNVVNVEEHFAVVGALGVRHPSPLTAYGDHPLASAGSADVDGFAHAGFNRVVKLRADETVLKCHTCRRRHGGHEAVLAEGRPVRRLDQLESDASQLGGNAALLVKTTSSSSCRRRSGTHLV